MTRNRAQEPPGGGGDNRHYTPNVMQQTHYKPKTDKTTDHILSPQSILAKEL